VRRAVVTGGASGIGAALVARLRAEGFVVESLDLAPGFDVTHPGD
jgi:2-hydroxycyclohexanecarboxyl-CoA dehydrogenase